MTKYIDKLNNHLSRGSEEQYNEMKLDVLYTNIQIFFWYTETELSRLNKLQLQ